MGFGLVCVVHRVMAGNTICLVASAEAEMSSLYKPCARQCRAVSGAA